MANSRQSRMVYTVEGGAVRPGVALLNLARADLKLNGEKAGPTYLPKPLFYSSQNLPFNYSYYGNQACFLVQ